jgi:hypothetical protein
LIAPFKNQPAGLVKRQAEEIIQHSANIRNLTKIFSMANAGKSFLEFSTSFIPRGFDLREWAYKTCL